MAALREVLLGAPGSTTEAVAARGIAELIGGEPEIAVSYLEKAVAARPKQADLLSDLAVAYLTRARSQGDPLSLSQALETAAQAVAAEPGLPEARFNLALALESLSLDGEARRAWKEFLRLDSRSGWAAEARDRLRSLPSPMAASSSWSTARMDLDAAALRGDNSAVRHIVELFPQAAREYAEERLLGDWAREQRAGKEGQAAGRLKIARSVGIALADFNGELILSRSVDAIEEAVADHGGDARLDRLAKGHGLYQEGLHLVGQGRIPEAADRFSGALDLLKSGGSPFAAWAAFRVAVCEVLHFQYDRALQSIDTLQASPEGQTFRSLSARSYWIAGLIHGIQARPTESIAAYRKSARIFSAVGEVENAANANARLGESLEVFGDVEGAWSHYALALRSLRALREPVRREFILEGGSLTALRMGRPRAALALQQEAVGTLSESEDPAAWVYCLRRRALIEIHAGLMEEARHDLAAARNWLAKLSDPVLRSSLVGDILVVEAQAGGPGDAHGAVAKLSKVVEIYRETGSQALLAVFLGRRGQAQAGLGRLDLAEADYREAIAAISRQHDAIQERDLQDWFLAGARSVFEGMVRLQAERGDAWQALSYAEKGRAQLFREQTSGEILTPEALDAEEIAGRIPSGTAVVEFLVADRQLLAWVIRRGSVELVRTPIVPAVLSRQVEQLRREVQGTAESSQSAARSLFALLLGRLRPLLQGAGTLVLVPDGDLYQIPFAALRDGSGRYLIEDHALIVSPSASLYVQALAAERKRPRRMWDRAMVLGDPSLDREVLSNLPRLHRSGEEAEHVASLYPEAALGIGPEATKRRFLEGLAKYDVLHFAGHAVVRPAAPSLSFLALAPSAAHGDSGVLYARDLYGLPAPSVRLVVLSACGTMQGDARVGEGVAGLARPFLSMGIPSVVGSLWNVDDRSSESLLVGFHRALRSGFNSAEALRRSQLEALKARSPGWAGFQLTGAGL